MSKLDEFLKDTQSAVRVALDEELSYQRDEVMAMLDLYLEELEQEVPDDFKPKDYSENLDNVQNLQDDLYAKVASNSDKLDKANKEIDYTETLVKAQSDNFDAAYGMIKDIHEAVAKDKVGDKVVAPPSEGDEGEDKSESDTEETDDEDTTGAEESKDQTEANKKKSLGDKIVGGLNGIKSGLKTGYSKLHNAYNKTISTISGFFNKWWQWVPELFFLINLAILFLRKMWYELKIQLGIAMDKTRQWLSKKLDNWVGRALGLAPDSEADKQNLTDEEYIKQYGVSKDGSMTYDQYVEQLKEQRDQQRIDRINALRSKRGEPLVDENGDTITGTESTTVTTDTRSNNNSVSSETPKVDQPKETDNTSSAPNNSGIPSVPVDDLLNATTNSKDGNLSMEQHSSVTVNNTNINVYPRDTYIDYV